MTWTKAVTIWCDGCNEWHDGMGGGTIGDTASVTLARKHGRAYGWTYRNGRDLCPECTAEEAMTS